MLPSYNHNVAFAGHTFHVQTEVHEGSKNFMVTHLFLTGDIIATTRTLLQSIADLAILKATMQQQHQSVMRALIAGAHNDTLVARGIKLASDPGR